MLLVIKAHRIRPRAFVAQPGEKLGSTFSPLGSPLPSPLPLWLWPPSQAG